MTSAGRSAGAWRDVDAVLFDYGQTLVDFERPDAAIDSAQREIAACIARAGHRAPSPEVLETAVHDRVEAEVAAHAGSGALEEIDVAAVERRAFADLGLHLDPVTLDRCSALIQEAWWQGVRVYPEAGASLRALRAAGIRVGLCSNAAYRAESMHAQLRHVGLDTVLDAAVFSAEVGWRKPSPHIFAAALAALDVTAEHTVFVGDRVREDVDGPAAVGMRTILVVRGADTAPASESSPTATVRSLADIVPLLVDTRL